MAYKAYRKDSKKISDFVKASRRNRQSTIDTSETGIMVDQQYKT